MKDTFSIKEAFSIGWNIFEENPWRLVGILSLAIVAGIVGMALEHIPFIGVIASILLSVIVSMGILGVYLQAHDKKAFKCKDVFNHMGKLLVYLVAKAFIVLIVFGGSVLLIVPGIIAGIALTFVPMLIIDKNMGIVESVKASWAITNGHKAKLLLFSIVVMAVNIIGLLTLVVGLVITIPVTYLASIHVYRSLLAQAEVAGTLPVKRLQTVPKVFAGIGVLTVVVALVAGAAFLKSETGQNMMKFVEMSEHRGGGFYNDEFNFDQELEVLEGEMSDLEMQY